MNAIIVLRFVLLGREAHYLYPEHTEHRTMLGFSVNICPNLLLGTIYSQRRSPHPHWSILSIL